MIFFCERFPNEVGKYLTKAIYLRDEQYALPNGMTLWASSDDSDIFKLGVHGIRRQFG